MKRALILVLISIFLISSISAELILTEQPNDLYNLGQVIRVPAKVATTEGIDEFFSMKLICNGIETEVHKQYIFLLPGEEQTISTAIPLRTDFIGRSTGTCTIKAILGENYILTNEFTISDLILITLESNKGTYSPEESLIIEGTAIKENQENVQGFIELKLLLAGEEILTAKDTVKNGYIYLNKTLPKDIKAGEYLAQIDVYETEGGVENKSNQGFISFATQIHQVPTSLEIIFEENPVIPGESLMIKGVLHDQTGVGIESDVTITLRNNKGKILEKKDLPTDEFLEYEIPYNEPASRWSVGIESNDIIVEEEFNISINEEAEIKIVNKTVIITNVGNVPYNDTALVKIGNTTVNLDVVLPIEGETQYALSAPEGEYEIEVRSGEEKISETVALTGHSIAVDEVKRNVLTRILSPFVWIFIIGILGFMAYMLYKKGYKKTFFGYVTKVKEKIKRKKSDAVPTKKDSLISPKSPAQLSLSIKGEKQDVSLICLRIKNEKQLLKNESVKEKLNEIVHAAEENKAVTYENQNNIFLIYSPSKTKTFKNQKTAVETAEKIKASLDKYNKLAKDKINYGISLNYGTIVAKPEKDSFKFMSMGTLITTAKKLASISDAEVLLSEKINEKVMADVKTEKHQRHNTPVYTVKEIRTRKDSKENKKFIHNFIKKLEDENKAKEKSK